MISGGADIALDGIEVSGFQHSGIEVRGTDRIRMERIHAFENGFAGISSGEPVSVCTSDIVCSRTIQVIRPSSATIAGTASFWAMFNAG